MPSIYIFKKMNEKTSMCKCDGPSMQSPDVWPGGTPGGAPGPPAARRRPVHSPHRAAAPARGPARGDGSGGRGDAAVRREGRQVPPGRRRTGRREAGWGCECPVRRGAAGGGGEAAAGDVGDDADDCCYGDDSQ